MPDQNPGESETPEPTAAGGGDAAPDGVEDVVAPDWFEWPDLAELDGPVTAEASAEKTAPPEATEPADEVPVEASPTPVEAAGSDDEAPLTATAEPAAIAGPGDEVPGPPTVSAEARAPDEQAPNERTPDDVSEPAAEPAVPVEATSPADEIPDQPPAAEAELADGVTAAESATRDTASAEPTSPVEEQRPPEPVARAEVAAEPGSAEDGVPVSGEREPATEPEADPDPAVPERPAAEDETSADEAEAEPVGTPPAPVAGTRPEPERAPAETTSAPVARTEPEPEPDPEPEPRSVGTPPAPIVETEPEPRPAPRRDPPAGPPAPVARPRPDRTPTNRRPPPVPRSRPEPPEPPAPAAPPKPPKSVWPEPVPIPDHPPRPQPVAEPDPPRAARVPAPAPVEAPRRPASGRGRRRRAGVLGRTRTRRIVSGGVAALLVAGGITGGILASQGDDSTRPAADDPTAATVTAPKPPPPVLAAHDDSGPMPDPGTLANTLRPALADPRLGGEFRGQVIDLSSGRELFGQDADGLATPASTTKLTTAAATLAALPTDHRFTTSVMSGEKPGDVVLVGGGDPTLSAAAPGEPTIYGGAARLSDLADDVRASGTQVDRVVVDTSLFTGPGLHPTWDPADVAGGDITPIRSLMVDGGRTAPDVRARSDHPALFAGTKFAAMLGLPDSAVVTGTAPSGARQIAAVESPPVNRLVEHMLRVSDNVIAEVLIRHVAIAAGKPASFTGGANAVRDTLQSLGIDIAGERLVDGSGLSDQDKLSPALLDGVLRAAAGNGHPRLHALFGGLPVAGYDGTLADRYRTDDTKGSAGLVRAKTGTLTGVATLAGLVEDADGRVLAFAFMANNVGSTFDADMALDKAVEVLAGCGCG